MKVKKQTKPVDKVKDGWRPNRHNLIMSRDGRLGCRIHYRDGYSIIETPMPEEVEASRRPAVFLPLDRR
jgi:hypothetical protein